MKALFGLFFSIFLIVGSTAPAAGGPDIEVDPERIEFEGVVPIGESRTESLQISNDDKKKSLFISFGLLDGCSDMAFEPFAPVLLSPKALIEVPVTYEPMFAGVCEAEMVIISNDKDESIVIVPLTGVGGFGPPEPDIDVDPMDLDFGQVYLDTSRTISVSVSNKGDLHLTITDLYFQNGCVDIDTQSPLPKPPLVTPPGQTIDIGFSFTPTEVGECMRIFEIKSNDPDEPIVTITLSGEGVEDLPVPDIEVNPANIDFDEVDVGASSKATVTVSNRGEADLTVNAFGPDGGCTDIQSNVLVDPIPDLPLVIPPVVIAPGQSGDVVFTFHPTQVGECTRVFRIESDDPNEGLAEITLTGAGVAIPILDLDVLLTPKNFVAFKGGTIEYQVVINNNTGVQQTFDFWVDVTLPNGTIFPSVGALLGPFRLVLAPSGTILEMIIHNIPRNALSGAHKLNATVGNFPASTVFDQAIFEFFIPQ